MLCVGGDARGACALWTWTNRKGCVDCDIVSGRLNSATVTQPGVIRWIFRCQEFAPRFSFMPTLKSKEAPARPPIYSIQELENPLILIHEKQISNMNVLVRILVLVVEVKEVRRQNGEESAVAGLNRARLF
ncbi:hypothetical protein BUALT_Bualt01G0134900 [Buddleja alternifolia]|uniref:Uncharacterized protein n=1 Tax=Buddleja alternifolia TaxID=168488 RepID=A0AAV6YDD1_9LAMI|nr:hypothetical protein BUALT_Bualt01G0134900 [Buddleja alternifolia]